MLVDPQKNDAPGETKVKDLADSELVRRFAVEQDEACFAEIVQRHGPLVWGVCRRVLANPHDEEDAFQATFMVLARNAAKVRRRAALASWLYGVAYRVAVKAFRKIHRYREIPLIDHAASEADPLERLSKRGDERAVDEELHALPEKYRAALILYYLENRTHQEIADQLHLSASAVDGRLKRGRAELRRRLVKRGISLSCFAALLGLGQNVAAASIPPALIQSTVEASIAFARGEIAAGEMASAGGSQQLALSEITEMTLFARKLTALSASAVLATAFGVYGLGVLVYAQEEGNVAGGGVAGGKKAVVLKADDPFGATPEAKAAAARLQQRAANKPPVTGSLPTREAVKNILSALDEQTVLEFKLTPLKEAFGYIAELHNIPIAFDIKSMKTVGITKDSAITRAVSGMSLRSALHLILEPLNLDFTIRDEVLVITSASGAEARLTAPGHSRSVANEINRKLDKKSGFDFLETPLSDACDFISEEHNISIIIDGNALDEIGVATDEPITMSLDDVSLRSALHLILEPLDLAYTIHDEVLMITSADEAAEQLDTRIYFTSDTSPSSDDFVPAKDLVKMLTQLVEQDTWEELGGHGVAMEFPGDPSRLIIRQTQRVHEKVDEFLYEIRASHRAKAEFTYKNGSVERTYNNVADFGPVRSMADLITKAVEPGTWEGAGGTGRIQISAANQLTIMQSNYVHDKVAKFLDKLRDEQIRQEQRRNAAKRK